MRKGLTSQLRQEAVCCPWLGEQGGPSSLTAPQACCYPHRQRHHVMGKSPRERPSAEAALGWGVGGSAPG